MTDEQFEKALDKALDKPKQLLLKRRRQYGDSVFQDISFAGSKRSIVTLSAHDVITLMIAIKIKRIALGDSSCDEDSLIDIIGYYLLREVLAIEKENDSK
jgi:hypothetical protein